MSIITNQSSFDELIDLNINTEIPNVMDCDNFKIIYNNESTDMFNKSKYLLKIIFEVVSLYKLYIKKKK